MRLNWCTLIVALAALLIPATWALAQESFGHVRATRVAVVRDEPNADAREIARLEKNDEANLAAKDPVDRNWYKIVLADGREGFVSRFRVRRREGFSSQVDPPVAPGPSAALSREERDLAAFHYAFAGQPLAYRELVRTGYVAGYDPTRKIPIWVQYRLTKARSVATDVERSDAFAEDADVPVFARAILDDYAGSGYARGHMAPADDMRFDETAELQSNLLTNIAPQIGPAFNGSTWKSIENRVRKWAESREDITIIMGPIFEPRKTRDAIDVFGQPVEDDDPQRHPRQMVHNVIGENDVAVPTHYFKIVADLRDPANPEVLAFMLPHRAMVTTADKAPRTWLRSVDDIEKATGIDFLVGLANAVEDRVEAVTPDKLWQ